MGNYKDLTNKKFGRLVVIRLDHKLRHRFWLCDCICGNNKVIREDALVYDRTKSCGCLRREVSRQTQKLYLHGLKLGHKHTEETKHKISIAHLGMKGTNIGKHFSDEHRRSISESHKGSKGIMWGKHHSPESKQRISNALRGIPKSDEMKRKLGLAHKGKVISKETREKLRQVNIGRKHTVETKLKLKQHLLERLNSGMSESATLFLDRIEQRYAVVIEREYKLGGFFFDGKVGNILIEVDGEKWHPINNQRDHIKDKVANNNGFVMLRFVVNRLSEVEKRLIEYNPILTTLKLVTV